MWKIAVGGVLLGAAAMILVVFFTPGLHDPVSGFCSAVGYDCNWLVPPKR